MQSKGAASKRGLGVGVMLINPILLEDAVVSLRTLFHFHPNIAIGILKKNRSCEITALTKEDYGRHVR